MIIIIYYFHHLSFLQERQRLETILSLCSERDQSGSAVADLQKINKELEKLQVSEDESIFSDSAENGYGSGALECQVMEERQVRQRRSSGQRDIRAESPAGSLHGSAPSPSPRQMRNNKVGGSCPDRVFFQLIGPAH